MVFSMRIAAQAAQREDLQSRSLKGVPIKYPLAVYRAPS